MIRPLALASLLAFAMLPSLPGAVLSARADGFAEPAPPPGWHPPRRAARPVRARAWAPAPLGVAPAPQPDLVYGWLPRNLNLPIYNAPSNGPAPTL